MTEPDQAEGPHPAERSARARLLVELVRAPDSYGLLLLVLVVDYVILSAGWTGPWALTITTVFICLTTVLAFHTSRVRGRLFRAVVMATGVALVASIVAAVAGEDLASGLAYAIMALLVLACPMAIVTRVIRHTRVTVETLLGAICVYVLIGLVFSYIDMSYALISGRPYFAQPGPHGPPAYVYFSFITMTTVGYGDLSPATGLPRTTAVFEALIGQIFLVVLVARLVAMYKPTSSETRRTMTRARLKGEAPAWDEGRASDDDVEDVDAPTNREQRPPES